ncbi:MAG: SDR family oxidoreductase [Calditrichia bacterium]
MSIIQGKNVLITGGASGIGKLMAEICARKNPKNLVIWDIQKDLLEDMHKMEEFKSANLITQICDIGDKLAVQENASNLIKSIGGIDILINNAGIVTGKSLLESSEEEIERTFNINTLSHFWTIKAFLPTMLQHKEGHIVTIASAASLIGVNRLADYSSSKFAVFGMHESLRMEIRRMKWPIKLTIVCPYYIDTGMFAGVKTKFSWILPILKPEKVAGKVIRAIEKNKSRVITPFIVRTVPLLRILPVSLFDWTTNFLGINNTMDDFVGRRNNQ